MSSMHEHRGEVAWGAFCVGCAVAMLAVPQWQTVPFHWIWITLTFLYGFRRWTPLQTAAILAAVVAVTSVAMLRSVDNQAELSEIPLMTCVFVGMVWHVRRRQEAVDAQRRVADREREFMHDAAHTLRTPLTVATGYAEVMLDGLEPRSDGHSDATVVLDELRRLSRIADQLLILGTAERADALLLAPVELDRLARTAAARWSAATGRAVAVSADEPVSVLADEERLRHALDALVENALHATAAGGEVAIAARADGGGAVLEVADTGPGIAPGDRARIFERFARGADGDGRPGTGLGLPIVRAIAAAHGGRVEVGGAPGAGAVFRLHLGTPLRDRAGGRPQPAQPAAQAGDAMMTGSRVGAWLPPSGSAVTST
jgi:two-component system OmpR family sensor kinase